jgi:hypothetical protein
VPLALADLAEERGDDDDAAENLHRAFALGPGVPLVQYRLGLAEARRGNRARAVFFLELAASSFGAGSQGRERAEFELSRLSIEVLEEAELTSGRTEKAAERFEVGESVVWQGQLTRHYAGFNPKVLVRWLDPAGEVAREENVRMSPTGGLGSKLDTLGVPTGSWTVEVRIGDTIVSRYEFEVVAANE